MATTLANLVTAAKTAANMQVGGPWSATEWNDAVNRSYEALWIDVIAANNTFRVTTTTFTINTGASSTTLPVDFMNALKVVRNPGTASRSIIGRSADEQSERTYRLEGNTLFIDPIETAPGSYQLRYNPIVTQMTAGIDMDAELAQHREYVELLTAIAALDAEESSSAAQMARFKECQKRALQWAASQRSSEPSQVRDVRPRWNNPRGYDF